MIETVRMEMLTLAHVAISLAGIFSGLVVPVALLAGKCFEMGSAFLLTTKYD